MYGLKWLTIFATVACGKWKRIQNHKQPRTCKKIILTFLHSDDQIRVPYIYGIDKWRIDWFDWFAGREIAD